LGRQHLPLHGGLFFRPPPGGITSCSRLSLLAGDTWINVPGAELTADQEEELFTFLPASTVKAGFYRIAEKQPQ
jgi:hypothetical protein